MDPRILAVIPARGGSKGVERKNIRDVCGKPLIAYTIECANRAMAQGIVDRAIVSTDDEEIADISKRFGADVPFMRPPELGADTTGMVPVLQHATSFVESEESIRYDWILLLQPTDPLRRVEDIAACVEQGAAGGCDSVISVVRVFATHPALMKKIVDDRLVSFCVEEKEGIRRQNLEPPAYMRNGAVYLTKRDVLMDKGSIWGEKIRPYIMPPERSVGVDDELDLKLLTLLLAEAAEQTGA